jgi:hypothetical protein
VGYSLGLAASVRLRDLSRREEALEKAQQAVSINEQLAQARPDAFLPDLARSLSVERDCLRALDRLSGSRPCDSGSRVAMGPKQNPRDDRQLEQRYECDSEQRVVERCYHAKTLPSSATLAVCVRPWQKAASTR